MTWSMIIPLFINIFCFWDAYEAHGYYPNWWSTHFLLALVLSGLAWLIWWVL